MRDIICSIKWPSAFFDSRQEQGGVILGYRSRYEVFCQVFVPCQNHAIHKSRQYGLAKIDVQSARDLAKSTGLVIVGMIHSHTKGYDGYPSNPDIINLKKNWVGAVYHVSTKRVRWYTRQSPLRKE